MDSQRGYGTDMPIIDNKQKNMITFTNTTAQYIVIKKLKYSGKEDKIRQFMKDEFFSGKSGKLKLPEKPKAVISVIGGAKYYESNSKLELVVKRGLIKAAQSLKAWILDGGMHAGVMKYVGESIRTMSLQDIPCIGVAPLLKVNNHEQLNQGEHCLYSMTKTSEQMCNLDPNHTHFILVNSNSTLWGEETEFLNSLQNNLVTKYDIPVIVIALSGGGVTLTTILNALNNKFPTIITKGTGRVCDALAALVSVARRFKIPQESCNLQDIKARATASELKLWDAFEKEERVTNKDNEMADLLKDIDLVLKKYGGLTIYSPDGDEGDSLDVLVLKGFLQACKENVPKKLETIIEWGDQAELVAQLIKKKIADNTETNPYQGALLKSLQFNRPNIFNVLCENHAYYAGTLRELYLIDDTVERQLKRGHLSAWRKVTTWPDKIRNSICTKLVNKRVKSDSPDFEAVLDIFCAIGPAFSEYASLCSQFFATAPDEKIQQTRLAFIDLLMWAVFTDRFELAKVVWRRTKYHVLSAMMACILYRFLADNAARKQEYLEKADWFENESLRILTYLDWSDAREFIKFTSPKALGNATLTDLAAEGKCKAVMAHPHVQQVLDEKLYSHENEHEIPSTLSSFQIAINVFTYLPRQLAINALVCLPRKLLCCPTIIRKKMHMEKKNKNDVNVKAPLITEATHERKEFKDKALYGHPRIFFNIPIVKFWSNSLFYILFLIFQAYVLLTIRDGAIHTYEYLLWCWVFSMLVEEIVEMRRPEATGYFSHFTNKMDITLLILNIVYIGFRLSHHRTNNFEEFSASVNALLAACVIGWLRLMAIFPVSSTFGPLFFILIKLFKKDFLLWAVLFSIFAVSFQIGFTSLALQAGMDPYEAYPAENGIFPVSYVAIIGEWAYLMTVMSKTPTGVLFLAVYAFIVQVMLVNLLIAMMGDTYSSMRENSDVEWKYYRHTFAMDNTAESCIPPPFNVLIHAYSLITYLSSPKEEVKPLPESTQLQNERKIAKVMRITVDKLAEENDSKENESPVMQIKKMKKAVSGKSGLRKLDDRINNQNEGLKGEITGLQGQVTQLTTLILDIQRSISGGNVGGSNSGCGNLGGNGSGGGNLGGSSGGALGGSGSGGGNLGSTSSGGNLGGSSSGGNNMVGADLGATSSGGNLGGNNSGGENSCGTPLAGVSGSTVTENLPHNSSADPSGDFNVASGKGAQGDGSSGSGAVPSGNQVSAMIWPGSSFNGIPSTSSTGKLPASRPRGNSLRSKLVVDTSLSWKGNPNENSKNPNESGNSDANKPVGTAISGTPKALSPRTPSTPTSIPSDHIFNLKH